MANDRRGVILVYLAIGLLLLPFPLVGILHAESSAIVAAAAFLVSSMVSARGGMPRPTAWTRLVVLAFIPAALLLLSMLWRPNCGWPLGLLLYVLFVTPSVLLGAAIGAVIHELTTRFWMSIAVLAWLFLLVVPTLVTLKNHPQFFLYNSVFGGVLGPIYDDELALRAGFFWHRLRTVLWAAWLVLFVRWRSSHSWPLKEAIVTVAVTVILGSMYLFQARLGIVQTEHRLAESLGSAYRSASLVVHFDSLSLSRRDVALLAREQEYRLAQIATTLELPADARDEPIHVFLYPDEETKGHLTGARRTSVAPVWLEIPQVHLLQDQVLTTLTHELVHVLARTFGGAWTGASWSVGLVEGLAAALEPPRGYPALDAQVVASGPPSDKGPALVPDPAHRAADLMAPWRFWLSRQAMAYAVSGAFTDYLLNRYGADALKKAYRTASFEDAYGRPLAALAREWAKELEGKRADSNTVAWVRWIFSQPSLFERRCPHHVPGWLRRARTAGDLRNDGRFREALSIIEALRRDRPNAAALAGQWAGVALAVGVAPDSVLAVLDAFPDSLVGVGFLVRRADALRIAGRDEADAVYRQAVAASPPFPATTRAFIRLRSRLGSEGLRVLLQGTNDDSTMTRLAGRLERLPGAGVFSAAFYASAGRYEQAWSVLKTVGVDVLNSDEQRAVRLYALEWAIAAGRLEEAEELATRLFVDTASPRDPLTALASDRLGYIRWLQRRGQ